MKTGKLDQMRKVTEAIYHSEFQKVQPILAEEARLRSDLANLQAQSKEQGQALRDDIPMQAIGADVLWQAWLARMQRQLNMELAQVMARKLTAMDHVRKAFGRQSAVESMLTEERTSKQNERRKAALEKLLQSRNMR